MALRQTSPHRTARHLLGWSASDLAGPAHAYGLALTTGDTSSVGIAGLTTGGGIGFMSRKFGLTIDNLLSAEVVTAEGEVLRTSATEHPDLFWAIRGGGGNFGVATRFRFRLHELDQVVGGILVLPATAETVAGFVAAAEAAPDELTAIANTMNCPPLPFVEPEHHGTVVILAMICWAGDVGAGRDAVAPFVALAEPLADLVRPIPYPDMFPPEDPDYRPTAVGKTEVALLIAESLGVEILSVDSRQIYRRLDLGTAKPSPSERARVLHHLIDELEPAEACSAEAPS
jgi:hypothetical protein